MSQIIWSGHNQESLPALYRNLRAEQWLPDISGWATTINDYDGFYQVVGKAVFINLWIDSTDFTTSSDSCTLPIKPMTNGGYFVSSYNRYFTMGNINMYDHNADTSVEIVIDETGLLVPANYAPASGRRLITISGHYWV